MYECLHRAIHESKQVRTYTKTLHLILGAKYECEDLNKVMKNQYQYLTETQHDEVVKILQNSKSDC